MFNVLVTGSNGQLGSEIKELILVTDGLPSVENSSKATSSGEGKPSLPKTHFFFTDKNELDISDVNALKNFVETNGINAIINCAAYTAVDKAESDEQNADKINRLAVKQLAQISKEKNIKLIHVSTDYVFDGENYKPYTEDDATSPNGVYGSSKLEGEKAMQEINPKNSIIIRTSWVYSSYGNNFVKTMLRLGKEKEKLGVIYDQVGTPTYAKDLAKAILEILPNIKNEKVEIYNYSNEGVLSWYDFAKEIMRMAKLTCEVNPIETTQYPTPAKRPHYSLLNKSKIKKEFGIIIPYWKDSLDKCLRKMGGRK